MSAPAVEVNTRSCGPIEVGHTSDGVVITTPTCAINLSVAQALELLGAIAVHRRAVVQHTQAPR